MESISERIYFTSSAWIQEVSLTSPGFCTSFNEKVYITAIGCEIGFGTQGAQNPVQRCRHHKIENVMGYLAKHLKEQVKAAMRAAFRLSASEGMARLEKQAQWLEGEHPDAAASLREGFQEMFTINRLGLSPSLLRCLSSTNIIESPHSGVRLRTRRICR